MSEIAQRLRLQVSHGATLGDKNQAATEGAERIEELEGLLQRTVTLLTKCGYTESDRCLLVGEIKKALRAPRD